MITDGYQITNRKIESSNHKFDAGDIIQTQKSASGHDNEIGIVVEVRDERESENVIGACRDWYYYVEYDGGGSIEREGDLILIKKKAELFGLVRKDKTKMTFGEEDDSIETNIEDAFIIPKGITIEVDRHVH